MSYEHFYTNKRAKGATQTNIVNIGDGLNEFLPPVSLKDGQLSASRNWVSNDGLSISCIPYAAPVSAYDFVSTDLMATYNGVASGVRPLMVDKTTFLAKMADTTIGGYEVSTVLYDAGTESVTWTGSANTIYGGGGYVEKQAGNFYGYCSIGANTGAYALFTASADVTGKTKIRVTRKLWAGGCSGYIIVGNTETYVGATVETEPSEYSVVDFNINLTGVQLIQVGVKSTSVYQQATHFKISKIELIYIGAEDLTPYAFHANPLTSGAVKYITAADDHSVYWSQMENFLLVQAHSTRVMTIVTLPSGVYPISCAHHVNRIFILDTNNYLWWSKAGDYTTWYGVAVSAEYEAEDAGYWLVASSDTMNQIIPFRENLYIFGNNSIYVFTGYSIETFALQKLFTGIGSYAWSERSIYANNNMLYFTYKDRAYVFDGNSFPSVISEPIIANESFRNGIEGGIKPNTGFASVADNVRGVYVDEKYLYLYPFSVSFSYLSGSTAVNFPLCFFNIERKTWWKRDAFQVTTGNTGHMYLFPSPETSGNSWARTLTQTSITTVNVATTLSCSASLAAYTSKLVTKAFNTRPSDLLTLSDIYITYQNISSANVTLDVEMSANGNNALANFTETLYNTEFVPTTNDTHNISALSSDGKPAVLHIPVYNSNNKLTMALANSPFFRLMFTVTASAIDILRVELRYRSKGASR